jgi:hypothetical protein
LAAAVISEASDGYGAMPAAIFAGSLRLSAGFRFRGGTLNGISRNWLRCEAHEGLLSSI